MFGAGIRSGAGLAGEFRLRLDSRRQFIGAEKATKAMTTLRKKLQNPFALVVQGFLVGGAALLDRRSAQRRAASLSVGHSELFA